MTRLGSAAIRVLLVDDHPVVRDGLRLGLEAIGGISVVAVAGSGATAIEIGSALRPDVALFDVVMGENDGIDAAVELKHHSPATRIALMSGAFDFRTISRGQVGGAHGLILKTEHPCQFAAFIHVIHRGGYCCSDHLRTLLVPGPHGFQFVRPTTTRMKSLTVRESELLVKLANGASLKQAARSSGISYKSADHLKQSLMQKLDIHDRVELVRLAIREGLCS